MIIFAPIKNFNCGVDDIDLGSALSIVRFSEKEINELQENFKQPYSFIKEEEFRKVANYFHLRRKFEEKIITSSLDETWDIFDNVITALRVFQKGIIWFDLVYSVNPIGRLEKFPKPIFLSYPPGYLGNWNYYLSKENVPSFKEFCKKFSKAIEKDFIAIAIRRFSESSEKRKVDDHLIDYFISFEFLFSDGGAESTHKVARRTAVFLEKEMDNRKEIYRDVKKAYNERSNILHGRKIDYEKIEEYCHILEKYLRDCLRKIIEEKRYNKKDLLEYLDFG